MVASKRKDEIQEGAIGMENAVVEEGAEGLPTHTIVCGCYKNTSRRNIYVDLYLVQMRLSLPKEIGNFDKEVKENGEIYEEKWP